jgi:pimeloyl-ACP methyl ester carboxylesterase
VIPYYQSRGLAEPVAATMEKADDLRTYESGLRSNPKIRLIFNQNDFLLADQDLDWFHATFTPAQMKIFPQGGHLGNLDNPTVQKAILAALTPMRPPDPTPEIPVEPKPDQPPKN